MPTPIYDKEKPKEWTPPKADGSHDDLGVHPERKEAEVDDLEKLYNAEAAPEKKPTRGEAKESSRVVETTSDDGDEGGRWKVKTSGDKQRTTLRRKRFLVGGGAAGLLIGSSVAFFGFLSGPLQFIHFAKVLESLHLSNQQDFTDSRTGRLIRWARTQDNPQNRNLSASGNRIANHYEAKLRNRGIEFNYDRGRLSSITVDTSTDAGKKLIAGIEAESGVTFPKNQKVPLSLAESNDGWSNSRTRRMLINNSVDAVGLNKVSSSLASRMLKIRAGVDFHPLKNLARSADERLRLSLDEYKQKVKDERNKRIKEGVQPDGRVNGSRSEDPDAPESEDNKSKAAQASGEIEDLRTEVTAPDVDTKTKIANVKGKLTSGIGIAGAIGTMCGLRALGDASAELQEANIVMPLIRTGMSVITVGSQIQSGNNVSMDEIGALSDDLFNREDGTSWASAASIQAEQGKSGVGKPIPDSAKPGKEKPTFFKVVDRITNPLPCDQINSTLGGLALTVGGIVLSSTGPISVLVNGGVELLQNQIMSTFIDDLVRWLAGDAVDLAGAAGADFGNYANYGAFLANNNTMKGIGGRALTDNERLALNNHRLERTRQEMNSKSFFARYLDITEPNSLIAKTAFENPELLKTQSNIASVFSSPLSSFAKLGQTFASLNKTSYAQTSVYDYGVDAYGFSLEEMESARFNVENPYDNARFVEPKLGNLNEEYGEKCFGTTINPSSYALEFTQAPTYAELEERKELCSNPDNEDLVRYRFYLADRTAMASMSCYEGIDETACSEIGMSNTNGQQTDATTTSTAGAQVVGNPYESSVSVACAEGTNDLGIHTGYTSGSPVQHRLCAVPNLPSGSSESTPGGAYYIQGANGHAIINSRLSGALLTMVNDAQSAGITLTAASSFRTMPHQESLWNQFGRDPKRVARPGSSPHQAATAIDFTNMGTKGGSSGDCSNRKRADGDARWEWLFTNAERYGFKQYSYEPWHWDPGPPGVNNRCDSSQP